MNRVIPFQGTHNFRDLGGYPAADGRKVKMGLFFRSDELFGLTEQDREAFQHLNIKTIFDYRSDYEVQKKPDPVFPLVNQLHIQAISSDPSSMMNMPAAAQDQEPGEQQQQQTQGQQEHFIVGLLKSGFFKSYRSDHMMLEIYKQLPFENPAYKSLMGKIQNPENLGLLQHCTAGKDRTGVGAALILMALGVSKNDIMEDYLLTNVTMRGLNEQIMARIAGHVSEEERQNIEGMLGIKEEYLEAAFTSITEKYGNEESYLVQEFGLTADKLSTLREMCLE